MKVAVVHSGPHAVVLQHRGRPVDEAYDDERIAAMVAALESAHHRASAVLGDGRLIDRLRAFFGVSSFHDVEEPPGFVLNVAYGFQGRSRYTQVPALLEMLGVPYVGSSPLAHALALDKAAAKSLWKQAGLPTPDFALVDSPEPDEPPFGFPVVAKPRAESTSMGLHLVEDLDELRRVAREEIEHYGQPLLVEELVEGRELNVSLLGNDPPEALPIVEVCTGPGSPIYTRDDKAHVSGRDAGLECPARFGERTEEEARRLARAAFVVLGCEDWARVDLRLDSAGELRILELNSLPHLSPRSSFVLAARAAGMELPQLLDRLVASAEGRYRRARGAPTDHAIHR